MKELFENWKNADEEIPRIIMESYGLGYGITGSSIDIYLIDLNARNFLGIPEEYRSAFENKVIEITQDILRRIGDPQQKYLYRVSGSVTAEKMKADIEFELKKYEAQNNTTIVQEFVKGFGINSFSASCLKYLSNRKNDNPDIDIDTESATLKMAMDRRYSAAFWEEDEGYWV